MYASTVLYDSCAFYIMKTHTITVEVKVHYNYIGLNWDAAEPVQASRPTKNILSSN